MDGYADRVARAHRAFLRGAIAIDPLEAMDAAHEDAAGRLPHDPEYVDPWNVRLGQAEPPQPVSAPEPVPAVPDLIPDWVLADAEALLEQGFTLRKVATAVLPMTECDDVPSCEQLLDQHLKARN